MRIRKQTCPAYIAGTRRGPDKCLCGAGDLIAIEPFRVEISQTHSTLEEKTLSYSISTLMTRNLHDVFGENDPARRRAAVDEIFAENCVFYDPSGGVHRGRDEIDRVAGAIRATHPDFRYQPIAEPENWAMAVGSSGCRAALARRQLTPELTSLLPGMAGLPRFISFSTNYPELDSAARARS
jgi:hypothetical protein